MPPGCGVRLLATIGHLLEIQSARKGAFFLTCPWKLTQIVFFVEGKCAATEFQREKDWNWENGEKSRLCSAAYYKWTG